MEIRNNYHRTLKIIVLCIVSTLFLTIASGCWDRRELEERNSVVGIAIDTERGEDGRKMYKVTMQIPIPLKIAGGAEGGGGGGGINSVRVISSTGFSVADAVTNLQKRLNQQVFLGHTRVLALGEDVAQEGVRDILDVFRRDPALRRLLWFLIVEGKASDILEVDAQLEQIPVMYILTMFDNGTKMEQIPDVTLGKYFIAQTNRTMQPILNYVKAGTNNVSWTGVTLFQEDKLVGKLNSKQSWILTQLRYQLKGGDFLIFLNAEQGTESNKHITLRPKQIRTKLKSKVLNGQVYAHYDVYLQVDLLEEANEGEILKSTKLDEIGKKAELYFEDEAKKVIDLLQNKYKIDSLNLGQQIKAYHYSEWKNMNWKEEFPKANIDVNYRVKIRRIGMKLK